MKLPKVRLSWPGRTAALVAAFGATILLLTSIQAVPIYKTNVKKSTQTIAGTVAKGGKKVAGGVGSQQIIGGSGSNVAGCAPGQNGGSTDTGVTGNSIQLGATVVRSGIGSSFLGGSPTAMKALADYINSQGGICGRQLVLKMVDDGWDAARGVEFLRNLIAGGVFALAVSPSSEGVDALIKGGDLIKSKVPLVGADGMVKSEYLDPYVWPVATSTVSSMHIMVEQAYRRGFRSFGIVFDKNYHFGVEGAKAFNAEVKRLTGHNVPGYDASLQHCTQTFCGIQSGQPSYPEVSGFNNACNQHYEGSPFKSNAESCNLVALLLEPKTALTWLANGGIQPGSGRAQGPQPLFNADFAKSCGSQCQSMVVWTSFNPPIGSFGQAVSDYVNTVRRADQSLDVSNSFTEGSFLGMGILIEALRRVGPHLTRDALKQVLDQGAFDLGLAPAIAWAPGNHLGNGMMQAYEFQYSGNNFIAFHQKQGFVHDDSLGKDLND